MRAPEQGAGRVRLAAALTAVFDVRCDAWGPQAWTGSTWKRGASRQGERALTGST